jgi:hypothetical protein
MILRNNSGRCERHSQGREEALKRKKRLLAANKEREQEGEREAMIAAHTKEPKQKS